MDSQVQDGEGLVTIYSHRNTRVAHNLLIFTVFRKSIVELLTLGTTSIEH